MEIGALSTERIVKMQDTNVTAKQRQMKEISTAVVKAAAV